MEKVTRELERIRRQGWWLLLIQRSAQVAVVAVAMAVGLGLMDYLLRLPGWMRLIVLLGALAAVVAWAGPRLSRAYRFWPELAELALRAERLMPPLAGRLASAVEFTLNPQAYAAPQATAALAEASVGAAASGVDHARLGGILDTRQTRKAVAAAGGALLVLLLIVAVAPAHAALAAQRWLAPLGAAEWPRRVHVADLTDHGVRPADAPVRLAAEIERGYVANMRVWAHYRVVEGGSGGRFAATLMSEQLGETDGRGRFESLVELPEHLAAGVGDEPVTLEYYLEAGDHRTARQELELVDRPRVRRMAVHVTPPAYAQGLIEPRWLAMDVGGGGAVASVAALAGSELRLRIELNKPLPMDEGLVSQTVPGLAGRAQLNAAPADERAFELTLTLDETVETTVELVDEHGLASHSPRRYRIEALADQPPAVTLVAPESDEAVMPTATVPLAGRARDDVGLEELSLRAEVHRGGEPPVRTTLDRIAGRRSELALEKELGIASLDVEPGDTVAVYAEAQDVFELDGQRHEPVLSVQRHLRIIGESELIDELRRELAAVRQQAVRMQRQQEELTQREPGETLSGQRQITERSEAQQRVVDGLGERAQRNELDEPALEQMLERARGLLDASAQASERARQAMQQAAEDEADEAALETGRQEQAETDEALRELIALLDDGRDALTLQLELRRLRAQQEALELEARRLLPQTVGEDLEDLSPELREALAELAQSQAEAGQDAASLMQQMREAARRLGEMEDATDEQLAQSEALDEAVDLAEREALDERMQAAAEAAEENRLSQAGQDQQASLETIQEMLDGLEQSQDQRSQAMLRRRLEELARTIRQLIERQQAQIAALEQAQNVPALEPAQAALRQRTMAAAHRAGQQDETRQAGELLDEAVDAQADAVRGLRGDDRPEAEAAKAEALEHLEAALEAILEQQRQAEQEERDEERRQLQERYEALADQQDELRERVEELDEAGALDRRQRAELIRLGREQEDLRAAAAELGEDVGEVILFEHLHQRIESLASSAAARLERAETGRGVTGEQATVSRLLRTAAMALDDDMQPAEFAGEDAGGGGGGGGGDMPELVPPIAELRVLRELQQVVHQQTRAVDEDAGAPDREARLRELGEEQGDLSSLGQRLIEQLEQAQQGAQPMEMEQR